MITLRRLKINKHRNVEPTELRFADGHNFVLGKNGTGKTSLLNLIVTLLRGDLRGFLERREEIDVEMELGGVIPQIPNQFDMKVEVFDAIRVIVEREENPEPPHPLDGDSELRMTWHVAANVKIDIQVVGRKIQGSDGQDSAALDIPASLRGTILFSSSKGAAVEFGQNSLSIPKESVAASWLQNNIHVVIWTYAVKSVLQDREQAVANVLRQVLAQSLLTPFGNFGRFDEALGYYRTILDWENTEHDSTWPWAPTFHWRKGEGRYHHAVPGDVSTALVLKLNGEPQSRRFELADVEPLKRLAEAFGATQITAIPRHTETAPGGMETFRGFDFYIHWPDGSGHAAASLSFGQKRLLAFLWYAATLEQAPAITDELTNGLHVEWVFRCIQAIGDRQAFHAVQNPLLVDRAGGVESVEQIARSFVFCHTRFEEGRRRWIWRNPTPEEAEMLDGALSVGIQQISEILLNRGLW